MNPMHRICALLIGLTVCFLTSAPQTIGAQPLNVTVLRAGPADAVLGHDGRPCHFRTARHTNHLPIRSGSYPNQSARWLLPSLASLTSLCVSTRTL